MYIKIHDLIIRNKNFFVFLAIYCVFRVFILNTNSAEWGDSYRILRATEFLQNFTYPDDEKRPPMFSVVLLFKFVDDPVFSGRITMLLISIVNITLLYILSSKILTALATLIEGFKHIPLITVILFSVSPLFLYWSLRIYADNLFLSLMMFSFILYFKILDSSKVIINYFSVALLSLVAVVTILTRFEGYLVFGSLALSFLLLSLLQKNSIHFRYFIIYTSLSIFLTFLVSHYEKFTFYQNPLLSSYVDEVESRKLTGKEVANYFSQLMFLSGSAIGIVFLFFGISKFKSFKLLPLYIFTFLQLVLSFIWFAAVPRLFLPILPLYIFLIVLGVCSFHEFCMSKKNSSFTRKFIITALLSVLVYPISQYFLKVPFLITGFKLLAINSLVAIFGFIILVLYIYKVKSVKMVFLYLFISSLVWSYLFVTLEKDIYKVLNRAVGYYLNNISSSSVIMTNDVSSISKFYFKEKYKYSSELDSGKGLIKALDRVNPDYLIVTNEHNPQLSFTYSKYPGLKLVKEFRENVNSKVFFTQIIKFDKVDSVEK